MQTGDYPSKLKHAKIIPVFKTGDETEAGNYRPISLLSVFNRLFERLMHKRLTSFIEKKHILFKSQYGFRENFSTQHAILDIVSKIQSNVYERLYSCGVFIDLKRPLTPLIIPYYCANCITMVYAGLSMIGSLRIYLIGLRQLKLVPIFLAKIKYYLEFLKALS